MQDIYTKLQEVSHQYTNYKDDLELRKTTREAEREEKQPEIKTKKEEFAQKIKQL